MPSVPKVCRRLCQPDGLAISTAPAVSCAAGIEATTLPAHQWSDPRRTFDAEKPVRQMSKATPAGICRRAHSSPRWLSCPDGAIAGGVTFSILELIATRPRPEGQPTWPTRANRAGHAHGIKSLIPIAAFGSGSDRSSDGAGRLLNDLHGPYRAAYAFCHRAEEPA
jgi:hypothetical protein